MFSRRPLAWRAKPAKKTFAKHGMNELAGRGRLRSSKPRRTRGLPRLSSPAAHSPTRGKGNGPAFRKGPGVCCSYSSATRGSRSHGTQQLSPPPSLGHPPRGRSRLRLKPRNPSLSLEADRLLLWLMK
ncbi:dynein light chain Tctex-type 1 isoform X1 [Notamacropus eugenii]|uniref:dynein light chain Tctex-type 1 isoform X1 n=1 Tax=Notamacropus eugenii TaxID=9315 RepID=UPI003B67DE80